MDFHKFRKRIVICETNLSYPKMPVITRSSKTGPTKMSGVKRRLVEIMESDDETATIYSDSDSEFHPDPSDELEDDVEDMKDELQKSEQENETLLNLLVKERETTTLLRQEIELVEENLRAVTEHRDRLIENIKEYQNTTLSEVFCFSAMLAITAGATLAAMIACNDQL